MRPFNLIAFLLKSEEPACYSLDRYPVSAIRLRRLIKTGLNGCCTTSWHGLSVKAEGPRRVTASSPISSACPAAGWDRSRFARIAASYPFALATSRTARFDKPAEAFTRTPSGKIEPGHDQPFPPPSPRIGPPFALPTRPDIYNWQ